MRRKLIYGLYGLVGLLFVIIFCLFFYKKRLIKESSLTKIVFPGGYTSLTDKKDWIFDDFQPIYNKVTKENKKYYLEVEAPDESGVFKKVKVLLGKEIYFKASKDKEGEFLKISEVEEKLKSKKNKQIGVEFLAKVPDDLKDWKDFCKSTKNICDLADFVNQNKDRLENFYLRKNVIDDLVIPAISIYIELYEK